jgi:hypothetical protein
MSSLIEQDKNCKHHAIRKVKERNAENLYVCGNCSRLFEVKLHEPIAPSKGPMFDRRPPWGLRDRQA